MRTRKIGDRAGSTRAIAMKLLDISNGVQTFASYTFTDLSDVFLKSAEDRFKDYRNSAYRIMDISQGLLNKGFEVASFDVINSANVHRSFWW